MDNLEKGQPDNDHSSKLQRLGEQMATDHGFMGVPSNSFEAAGRNQFVTLLELGLLPESRIVEIGCGVLRVAYWLIRFLDPDCYYGIEPAKDRVDMGKQYLFSPEMLARKNPAFDFNAAFDTSVFNQNFDFFLAGSIWTHCSKHSIQVMLDGFVDHGTESAVFLASYLPAKNKEDDYQGDRWVGTSHESNEPGCIKHSREWIVTECQKRGLLVEDLAREAFDSQYWLKITRQKEAI